MAGQVIAMHTQLAGCKAIGFQVVANHHHFLGKAVEAAADLLVDDRVGFDGTEAAAII